MFQRRWWFVCLVLVHGSDSLGEGASRSQARNDNPPEADKLKEKGFLAVTLFI
jgi:hypothetical protein